MWDAGKKGRSRVCTMWLAAGLLGLVTPRSAAAREPLQIWFDQAVDAGLTNNLALRAGQSLRYSCDTHELAVYFLEAGGGWKPRPWLSLGLAYRQQYERRDREWLVEHRPYAELSVRWQAREATLSNRSRLECRDREARDGTTRVRNKTSLQLNRWRDTLGISPYVAGEVFVDESVQWHDRGQVRLTVGARLEATWLLPSALRRSDGTTVDLDGYLTQRDTKADGVWTDDYILGLQLGIHF